MLRWTDARLDALRCEGDLPADTCLAQLYAEHGTAAANLLFQFVRRNDARFAGDIPRALADFFAATRILPDNIQRERLRHGEDLFMQHAFPACLALLAKSLPSGYAAPCLARILNLSGELVFHPYRRVLGVLQMVVNVCTCRGFETDGTAIVTAQKVRLLHAGVRYIVRQYLPDYEATYGVPVNQEDMLYTILAFSYQVLVGLRQLGTGLSPQEEEDFFYVWRIYARLMGIHTASIPENVADAEVFYTAYTRRHYVTAVENPDGVMLAQADLQLLQNLIPRLFRFFGLGIIPRIYMQELIGSAGCARVAIRPVPGHAFLKRFFGLLPRLWLLPWRPFDWRASRLHEGASRMLLQGLIRREYGGAITFMVPTQLDDLRHLA